MAFTFREGRGALVMAMMKVIINRRIKMGQKKKKTRNFHHDEMGESYFKEVNFTALFLVIIVCVVSSYVLSFHRILQAPK